MKFLILLIVLLIIGFSIEKKLNKLLRINKRKKLSETPGKLINDWGRVIIVVLFLCTLPFVINKDANDIQWYYITYLILLLGFQSILEWKYLKNSNQYIHTLFFLLLGVVSIYNIEFFLTLLK